MSNPKKQEILMQMYVSNLFDILSDKLRMKISEFRVNDKEDPDGKERNLQRLEKLKNSIENDTLYKSKLELSFLALISSGKVNAPYLEQYLKTIQDDAINSLKNDIAKLISSINAMPVSHDPIPGFEIDI